MDLGSLSVSVYVMMACLLGAAQLSSGDTHNCPCADIPPMDLTKPPQDCLQNQSHYRYQCVEGYLRKAGTSDLTRCGPDENGVLHWITPSLKCIRNHNCPCPHIPPMDLTKPPPEGCYQTDGRYRYECVDGFLRKAGTSDLTRCRPDENGVLHWNTPSLKCIPDPNRPIPPPPAATTPPPTTTPPPNTTITREEDSGTHTTAKAEPVQNSTVSTSSANSSTTSPPGAKKGKIHYVKQTQELQNSTVLWSNANSSTTTSPGVHKGATPTNLQTTKTVSTFNSVTGQRDCTKPTPHGKINSVTQTIVKNQTRTSTISPSTVNNNTISPPGALKGDIAEVVGISGGSLVIICAIIGISFFVYRWRSRTNIPQHTAEELRPMNCASAATEGV